MGEGVGSVGMGAMVVAETASPKELVMICNTLAEDLVTKSRLVSRLQQECRSLREQAGAGQKYHLALELVGEKEEEVESLREDLATLKALYREHVDEKYAMA